MTFTSLSFGTASAEVCTPSVAARLTALRVSQVPFPVILLFPFGKHERSTALRTHDFKVWHRGFSTRMKRGLSLSCSSERWRRVSFNHILVDRKRCFLKRYAEKLASRRFVGLSVLQQCTLFKFFVDVVWRKIFTNRRCCGMSATPTRRKSRVLPGTLVALSRGET